MTKILNNRNPMSFFAVVVLFSIFLFLTPHRTVNAGVTFLGKTQTVNYFNYFWGANPNDPDYGKYAKAGALKTRTIGNYGSVLVAAKPVSQQPVLYWDRPVTFYGVDASPTHGAAAITPPIQGKGNVYWDDLAPAGGPVYLSGANYGNGRPVGRAIDTNGARAIVPGGYSQ